MLLVACSPSPGADQAVGPDPVDAGGTSDASEESDTRPASSEREDASTDSDAAPVYDVRSGTEMDADDARDAETEDDTVDSRQEDALLDDGDSALARPIEERCADGQDNDEDGLIDCQDQDCAELPHCVAPEVWIAYSVFTTDFLRRTLYAASSRRPTTPIVIDASSDPLIHAALAFSWDGRSIAMVRSEVDGASLCIRSIDGWTIARAGPEALALHIDFSPDGKSLAILRNDTDDATGTTSSVVELVDIDHPGVPGRLHRSPHEDGGGYGRALYAGSDSRLWASRSIRLANPLDGDTGIWEVTTLASDATTWEVSSAGNVSVEAARRQTGEVHVRSASGERFSSRRPNGPWVAAPTGPPIGSVPVGEDMWVGRIGDAIVLWNDDLGTIAQVPLPEGTTQVYQIASELAPSDLRIEDLVCDLVAVP